MALFQKKPQTGTAAPLYSLGMQKTLLIVGLGNIGEKYHNTRHNIGFACVDHFAIKNEFSAWVEKKDLKAQITAHNLGVYRVILAKPTTLMNLSGDAVQAIAHFYKIPREQLLVVHDELDIPFGQIRMRIGGDHAGNNGIKSLINTIGKEFGRVRVGIQNEITEKADAADFVLGKFTKSEQAEMPNLLREVNAILTEYIYGGGVLQADTRTFIV
jgi:peptidyl-tRNA hydrolase, PTH1 family